MLVMVGAFAHVAAAHAQSSGLPIVGNLATVPPEAAIYRPDFERGLASTGYLKGRDYVLDYRSSYGRLDTLPELARSLVAERPVLIASFSGLPTTLAAKNATTLIPIVFLATGDPVQEGLVASLGKPGGNLTGFAALLSQMVSKQLQLLSELLPQKRRVGVLVDGSLGAEEETGFAEIANEAAQKLGMTLDILRPKFPSDLARAFAQFSEQHEDAVAVTGGPLLATQHIQLAALAARYGIPAVYYNGDLSSSGGLMTYGASLPGLFEQMGKYAGRIMHGAKPADLPVQQPERFALAINLKTAKILGITVPQSLLVRADQVIE